MDLFGAKFIDYNPGAPTRCWRAGAASRGRAADIAGVAQASQRANELMENAANIVSDRWVRTFTIRS